jgi:hypothetical protein
MKMLRLLFQDVIENDDIHLDMMFKLSLVVDICQVNVNITICKYIYNMDVQLCHIYQLSFFKILFKR